MKKAVLIALIVASCGSNKDLIQRSDISITTQDEKILYLKDTGTGRSIYEVWMNGTYGKETQVYLINESEFEKMIKKVNKS
jgi:hypothetical protein